MELDDLAYRKIIHVDMDAFYASVAQLDNPELKGKASCGWGRRNQRCHVAAASYEARKYGVKSAMSGVLAKQEMSPFNFCKTKIFYVIKKSPPKSDKFFTTIQTWLSRFL